MKDLKQQVSYLQGLADGMNISKESKEGRIIEQIIDVLDGIVFAIDDLTAQQEEMESYIKSVDDDLCDLEKDFYDEEDDDEDDDDYVEVKCPNCEEIVCFDADILDDEDVIEVTCPNCDEIVFINDGSYETDQDEEDESEEEQLIADNKKHTEDI
ncbi:MAG: CD1247 N-terminal domain-containing protein [Bacillota bacterium]|jgi:phage FluMu protein Com